MGRLRRAIGAVYEPAALTAGVYGAAKGLHENVAKGINGLTNGSLDSIVLSFPYMLQGAAEIAPYGLLVYALMKGGRSLVRGG